MHKSLALHAPVCILFDVVDVSIGAYVMSLPKILMLKVEALSAGRAFLLIHLRRHRANGVAVAQGKRGSQLIDASLQHVALRAGYVGRRGTLKLSALVFHQLDEARQVGNLRTRNRIGVSLFHAAYFIGQSRARLRIGVNTSTHTYLLML